MIILDTHIWVWWENGTGRLTETQREVIAAEYRAGIIGISAVTCWEIAMLVEKGRLQLHVDTLSWLGTALDRPGVELLPLAPEIAVLAYRLPEPFPPDPADRLIVATAIHHGSPLVTSDGRVIGSAPLTTIA